MGIHTEMDGRNPIREAFGAECRKESMGKMSAPASESVLLRTDWICWPIKTRGNGINWTQVHAFGVCTKGLYAATADSPVAETENWLSTQYG